MKTPHLLAIAALLPLAAACSDQSVTETAAAPAEPSAVMAAPPACVTFGPNPVPWTVWGAPVAQAPGTVVHSELSIDVSVHPLVLPGGPVYSFARLEPAAAIGWGSFNSLRMVDISTHYHFMAAGGWTPGRVRFHYRDMGAIENVAINGVLYVGDISAVPAGLAGLAVVVTPTFVDITGPVTDLRIGGENLRVEDVCAAP
jgi:hypothetical protein